MGKILVTGGAGYVGSHAVRTLNDRKFQTVVIDNLSEGHREAVLGGDFVEGDVADRTTLDRVFSTHEIEAVMHFAARCYVGESVRDPLLYYRSNLADAFPLLEAMLRHQVRRFIFSSSCAVYGVPERVPIREDQAQAPVNPYGLTKHFLERILASLNDSQGMRTVCLRYFNAAGASRDARIGESHDPETHLIPRVLQVASGRQQDISIFGSDYPTPDGTCIRDYVHIEDLAEGHSAALRWLLDGGESEAFNLGSGRGWSVREVVETARQISGHPIPCRQAEPRPGDPPELVADPARAAKQLGWRARRSDLNRIIEDAWRWECNRRY